MINKITFTLLLLLSTLTTIHAEEIETFGNISYEKATNISGKQRMLSQRIAKVYLIRLAGGHSPELSAEFNSSIQLFTRNLSILESNSKDSSSKVKASIKKEKSQWELFKKKLRDDKTTVDEVINVSNELLQKAHSLVLAIQEESKYNNEISNDTSDNQLKVETVNLSGKQRMLSQRLCLYYTACRLFRRDHKNTGNLCHEVEDIYEQMNKSLNSLLINDLNSFGIEANIGKILGVFNEIEDHKKDFKNNKIPLTKMITMTNSITNMYNIVTGQYASL